MRGAPRRAWRQLRGSRLCASSANLLQCRLCPPRAGIDRRPILAKFDVEDGLGRPDGNRCRRPYRAVAHDGDRLTGKNELPNIYVDLIHPGKNNVIALTGVDDQKLAIAAVRPGEGDPAVAGGRDDCAAPGRNENSFLGCAKPVLISKTP